MSTFRYRPDIDGLRAIAVLSVVIFHINPKWLPSGFLTLDIFLVVSGFLITSIIYREMLVGTFSFKEFYNRRIKRIFPLFFVVLITGLLACWYVFLPQDSKKVGDSVLSALKFLANQYFAHQGDYFDIQSNEKPFLHLWSLSLEEQFYFIFPVFLLLILRIPFLRRNVLIFLCLCVLGLLSSAFVDLKKWGIFWETYYLPHIRAGEILVGSFLAIYMTEEKRREEKRREREEKRREEKRAADYLGLILLAVLVISLFIDDVFVSPYFPGIFSLLPCLTTAGLIYIGKERNIATLILSSTPMVWIGKISYSLYLWHWVILAVMRYIYQKSELPISWIFFAMVMMLVLSVITYYFVENPCRRLKWSFGKSLAFFYVIPCGIVLMLIHKIQNNDALEALEFPINICYNEIRKEDCIKGDKTKKPKILFIGNSAVGALSPWIDKVGKEEGWSAMVISSGGLPFAFDIEWKEEDALNKLGNRGRKIRDEYFIKNYKNYPIIVFHYNAQRRRAYFYPKFIATIERLIKEGKKVYVITALKSPNYDVLRNYYLSKRHLFFREVKMYDRKENLDFIPDSLGVNKIDLRQHFPNSFYIDGKPILSDKVHWNTYGAEKMAEIFISKGKRFIKEEDLE